MVCRPLVGEVTITYNGTIYMVDADGTATLTVRGTTPSAKYGSVKAAETDIPNKAPGVVADEDTVYTINGNSVEVTDKIGILLLFDDIVETNDTGSTTNTALLESRATDELKTSNVLTGQGTRHYESKYLDLVDHNNGNAWVAADRNIQVYWPLPEGTDKNTKFELLHFEGLHREMGVDMVEDQIHTCNVVPMKIDKITDSHIVFTVSSSGFSPFVLAWESTTPVDPGTPDDYTLHYVTNGGEHLSSETKSRPWIKDYEDLPTPVRDGYTFEGWYWDLRLTEPVTGDVNVNKTTVSLYAKWSDNKDYTPDDTGVSNWLETEDHRLFLVGYPDDTFRPERNMTRAEVAQMFYALLLDQDVAITTTFSDVADEAWYATAVKTLASLGMMDGYPDGTFRPDAPITRAEFATVALAFAYDPASASCSYTDVNANAWYYTYVAQATTYGWIGGYPDGTFRPNNSITRAEVAVIVNNMLGRDADERYIDRNADELVHFVDLSKNHWAYYTIMEATNSHDYTKASAGETWKSVR